MNDPHVAALIYRVKHGPGIEYKRATIFSYSCPKFQLNLDKGFARFDLCEHFSNVDEARQAIADFIRDWESSVILQRGPDEFELIFAVRMSSIERRRRVLLNCRGCLRSRRMARYL